MLLIVISTIIIILRSNIVQVVMELKLFSKWRHSLVRSLFDRQESKPCLTLSDRMVQAGFLFIKPPQIASGIHHTNFQPA